MAFNEFHKLNYTIEMANYIPSKIEGEKRGKKIGERSVKELIGSSFEEFMDSDRYETYVLRTSHILVFKIIFDHPWQVSVN